MRAPARPLSANSRVAMARMSAIERAGRQSLDPPSGAHETVLFDTPFLGSHALGDDGTQLLALGRSLYRRDPASNVLSLFARVEGDIDNRLNDGRVDARGRFWVG